MAGPPSGTPHQPFQPFSEVTGVVMSRPAQPCAVHTGWEAWSPGSHVMVLWLYSVWKATRMCSWLPSDYTPGTAWTCTHPRPDKEAPSLSCVFQLQPSLAGPFHLLTCMVGGWTAFKFNFWIGPQPHSPARESRQAAPCQQGWPAAHCCSLTWACVQYVALSITRSGHGEYS